MYEPGRQYAAVAAACFERDETPVNLEALVHGDRSGGGGQQASILANCAATSRLHSQCCPFDRHVGGDGLAALAQKKLKSFGVRTL
jgi:hypothetical protein